MIDYIRSYIQARIIEIQRYVDHSVSRILGIPLGRFSKITPNLILGGQPYHRGIHRLKKWGVTAVLSMRMSVPSEDFTKAGFKILHLPTPDQTPVSMEHLKRGVLFIQQQINEGGVVYIHCWFGEGRGPSMVIAYLISIGLTFEDAIAQVKKVRTFISPTLDQIARLKEFELSLKKS